MNELDSGMPNIDLTGESAPWFSTQVKSSKRFFRPLSDDISIPLQVISGGRENCGEGYAINRKDFPYYTFEFVTAGSGVLILNGTRFDLYPGIAFFYGPGTGHSIQHTGSQILVKYFVNFTGSRAEFLLKEKLDLKNKVVNLTDLGMVAHSFEDLIESGLRHSLYSQKICGTLAELLLFKVADCALEQKESFSPAYLNYRQCLEKIENNFQELNTLEEMAGLCYLTPSYLCRLFKRYDHQPPYRFLQHLKISEASRRLLNGRISIKELAYETGFSDQFHFSRTFKQVMGTSPLNFLKLNQRG